MIQDLTPRVRDEGTGAPALRALLEDGGESWPAPLEHLAEVGSTNDRLKDRARAGAPELSVVLADAQHSGRGRQGRTWASPRGNLYVSVLLRPPARAAGLIPLAAGVAACEALASFGVAARLKWPNDVLVGERKIAGILAEASSGPARGLGGARRGGQSRRGDARLPAEATSVRAETGRVVSPAEAGAAVLVRLRVWYRSLASGSPAAVVGAWRERAVPWWGLSRRGQRGRTAGPGRGEGRRRRRGARAGDGDRDGSSGSCRARCRRVRLS